MATTERRDTELVEVRTMLPRYAVAKLGDRAETEGMRRSTLIRVILLREIRESSS